MRQPSYPPGVQSAAAQGGEDERSVAKRGCSGCPLGKAAVSGDDGDHEEADGTNLQLGEDAQPASASVRGTGSGVSEGEIRLHRPLDIPFKLLLSQTRITEGGSDKSAQGHETWLLEGQPPSSVYATSY